MRHELVTDEMWAMVAPLLPKESAKPKGGRPRVPDRNALRGIVFVLRSGVPWEMLPREWSAPFLLDSFRLRFGPAYGRYGSRIERG